ncbi:MAG: CusA/CzcA family heavy metal efflux RND transporter, partial [Pedobacter sp.]|nr:CusA/CzcA family heavy metal efflux RND transporter [Pedobacter sp.]
KTFADKMMDAIQRRYAPLLKKAISYPKTVILIGVVLFGIAFLVFRSLGGEFIPQLEEGDFALDARFLPGTSLSQTIKGMELASKKLKRFPEVQQVTCRIGSAEIPTDPMSLEQCDVFISLNDKSTWTTAKDYVGLKDTIGKVLAEIPGLNVGFEYPVQMRFNELISGAKQDVVVKIYGDDLEQLAKYAGQLSSFVAQVNGAADINTERIIGLPQLVIHYNRAALAQYNVSISQVNHVINATFAGQKAGSIYEEEKKFDVMLRMADSARSDIDHIGSLNIPTQNGQIVPLSQLADISIKDGPNQIQRDNGQRRIAVAFNVRGRDVESVVTDLQKLVSEKLKLPAGYRVEYGGQFENLNSAKNRLSIAVPASLLFIFILLYFAFNQFKEALIVFSAIPLAATGGVFSLWLRGMAFSISAGIGFIALFGVAVLNGIVLISEFNRLKKEGVADIDERIKQGTANRLRPVLMTATVASLGFFPMAISTHAGSEVQRPLATVVIGGLITATLLTLVVLPSLYKQFSAKPKKGSGKDGKAVLISILLLSFGFSVNAQIPKGKTITVEEALAKAFNQNNAVLAAKTQIEAARANEGTAFDIPKTALSFDQGNINSPLTDNRFVISQNFALPGLYGMQRQYFKAQSTQYNLQEEVVKNQLAYQIRSVYLEIATSIAKIKLLTEQDSIFNQVVRLEKLRFDVGEVSRVNLTSAEARVAMLRNEQNNLQTEIEVQQNRLQVLMASNEIFLPADRFPPAWQNTFSPDSAMVLQNPEVKQAKQEVVINDWKSKVNKSKALPDMSLAYSNQSFSGPNVSNTANILNRSNRYSSVMIGLNVPLFFKEYKSAIRNAELQKKSAQFILSDKKAQLSAQWQQAFKRYTRQKQSLLYYEIAAQNQADELLRTASLSFKNGDISYLEWANLYNQSIQLKTDRLTALLQIDQTVNLLWYYQAKTEKP